VADDTPSLCFPFARSYRLSLFLCRLRVKAMAWPDRMGWIGSPNVFRFHLVTWARPGNARTTGKITTSLPLRVYGSSAGAPRATYYNLY
jgi:hypothetical protein